MELLNKTCEACGLDFVVVRKRGNVRAKYCSARCKNRGRDMRAAARHEEASEPDTWANEWASVVYRYVMRGVDRDRAEERATAEMSRRLG